MNGEQAYRFAMANAKRDDRGNLDEKSLVELVAHAIDFDAEKERLGLAQRIVSRRKRPGQTDAAGTLCLPGLEPWAYEPDRLIADGEGNVIENWRATAAHKRAEALRSEASADRARERFLQDVAEADLLAEWSQQQAAKGRKAHELIWSVCARERGLIDEANVAA